MREYALIRSGVIVDIVATSGTVASVRARWPGYEVTPIEQVPLGMLQSYRYWDERP